MKVKDIKYYYTGYVVIVEQMTHPDNHITELRKYDNKIEYLDDEDLLEREIEMFVAQAFTKTGYLFIILKEKNND